MESEKDLRASTATKIDSNLKVLATIKIDPDICSWNSKKYPSLKISEVYLDKLINNNEITHELNSSPKPSLQKPKNLKISPEISKINISDLIPKPSLNCPEFDYFKSKPSKKVNLKKHLKKTEAQTNYFDVPRNESLNLDYSGKGISKSKTKRQQSKSVEKEKHLANTKYFFWKMPEISEKATEIFNKLRSQSPDNKRITPVLKDRLPIYTARTLEELLANSKLPEIVASRKSKLRPRYYNSINAYNF